MILIIFESPSSIETSSTKPALLLLLPVAVKNGSILSDQLSLQVLQDSRAEPTLLLCLYIN